MRIHRLIATGAIALFLAGPLHAGAVTFVQQERRVSAFAESLAHADEKVAPDFGPFSAEAIADFTNPGDGDRSFGQARQDSTLSQSALSVSGLVRAIVQDGGDHAKGESVFDVTFDVAQRLDYLFDLQVNFTRVTGDELGEPIPGANAATARLERVENGGNTSLENQHFEGKLSEQMEHFTHGGSLDPGRYLVHFDIVNQLTTNIAETATYDFHVGLSPVVPLPAAVWTGLSMLATGVGMGTCRRWLRDGTATTP